MAAPAEPAPDPEVALHALLIGSRPAEAYRALARLGVPFDVVLDTGEPPEPGAERARHRYRRPYVADPQSILTVPGLFEYGGVYSFTEGGLFPAALAAAVAGLRGPSPAAVLVTRDKYAMRRRLAAHGVTQPPFGLVDPGEPRPGADAYPLIVKPVAGSGSQGVREVAGPAEYEAALRETAEAAGPLMWEARFDGAQHTVEGVHEGGDFRVVAVTGKTLSGPPHFVVLEHESPARLDPGTRERLTGYARRCLDVLGVRDAATHTELAWYRGGPQLIETHTRPGGDTVPELAALTSGEDQYERAVATGWAGGLAVAPRPVRGTYARTLHLTGAEGDPAGLAADTGWLAELPEFVRVGYPRRAPRAAADGPGDPRWGQILLAGEDRAALAAVSRRVRERIRGRVRGEVRSEPRGRVPEEEVG